MHNGKELPSTSSSSASSSVAPKSPPHQSSNQTGVATPHPKSVSSTANNQPTRMAVAATPATMLVSGQQVGIALPGPHSVAPQIALSAAGTAQALLCSNTLAGPTNPTTIELLSAFECPVCMEHMLPPYLQCQSGHLVCGNCRPKVNCCPTCRGPVRKSSRI